MAFVDLCALTEEANYCTDDSIMAVVISGNDIDFMELSNFLVLGSTWAMFIDGRVMQFPLNESSGIFCKIVHGLRIWAKVSY